MLLSGRQIHVPYEEEQAILKAIWYVSHQVLEIGNPFTREELALYAKLFGDIYPRVGDCPFRFTRTERVEPAPDGAKIEVVRAGDGLGGETMAVRPKA